MEVLILGSALALVVAVLGLVLRREIPRWRAWGSLVRVEGEVTSYRSAPLQNVHEGRSWAPVYRLESEGAVHEVVSIVHSPRRTPPEGTRVRLSHPPGSPDLARPRSVFLWVMVAVLAYAGAVMVGRLAGWLG